MRILGHGFEAGFAAAELPRLVGDREAELEREGGDVGRGEAEEAAQRREAEAVEAAEFVLERLAGGKAPPRRRQPRLRRLERCDARFGAAIGGERAGPAGACACVRALIWFPFLFPFGLSPSKPCLVFYAPQEGQGFDPSTGSGQAELSPNGEGAAPVAAPPATSIAAAAPAAARAAAPAAAASGTPTLAPSTARRVRLCLPAAMPEGPFLFAVNNIDRAGTRQGGLF